MMMKKLVELNSNCNTCENVIGKEDIIDKIYKQNVWTVYRHYGVKSDWQSKVTDISY